MTQNLSRTIFKQKFNYMKKDKKLFLTNRDEKLELYFENEVESTSINDLVDYFRYLKAMYSYLEKNPDLIEKYEGKTIEEIYEKRNNIQNEIHSHFEKSNKSHFYISPSYQRHLGDHDIFIGNIKKQSPLSIVIESVGVLIVISAIISGGELDFGRMRFKLNALGDGVKKFREAFHQRERPRR